MALLIQLAITSTLSGLQSLPGPDVDAVAHKNLIIANGSTLSDSDLAALSDLYAGLKADGNWTAARLWMPFAGAGTAIAGARVAYNPLVAAGTGAVNLSPFGAISYGRTTGVVSNATGYFDTGLVTTNVVTTDGTGMTGGGLIAYPMSGTTASTRGLVGIDIVSNNNNFSIADGHTNFVLDNTPTLGYSSYTGAAFFAPKRLSNDFNSNQATAAPAKTVLIGSRVSGTDCRIYVNGAQSGFTQTTLYSPTSELTSQVRVFPLSDGNRSGTSLGFAGIANFGAITTAKVAAITNRINAFIAAVGR